MFEKSLSTNIELNLTKYNSKEYKLTMYNDKNHRILEILSRGPLLRALHIALLCGFYDYFIKSNKRNS
jgi:hypothetical protein